MNDKEKNKNIPIFSNNCSKIEICESVSIEISVAVFAKKSTLNPHLNKETNEFRCPDIKLHQPNIQTANRIQKFIGTKCFFSRYIYPYITDPVQKTKSDILMKSAVI